MAGLVGYQRTPEIELVTLYSPSIINRRARQSHTTLLLNPSDCDFNFCIRIHSPLATTAQRLCLRGSASPTDGDPRPNLGKWTRPAPSSNDRMSRGGNTIGDL